MLRRLALLAFVCASLSGCAVVAVADAAVSVVSTTVSVAATITDCP